jgi:NADH-quinone oxidoreductase subunit C
MSSTIEQLAADLQPLAVAEYTQLPPAPKPVPAKPAAAKPAAPGAAAAAGAAPAAPAAPATPPAPPPPPPPPPKPVRVLNFNEAGVHLDACITPDKVVESAKIMERHGYAIDAVTGMDWLAQGLMEVVYDYLHFSSGLRVAIRTRIPRSEPSIATISNVYQGANWHERETHDMFGITFVGHPDLTPFLLPDDADFHPLRKDYNP